MKKIFKKLVLIILIGLVSFFVYVKYWAGPKYLRKQFGRAVSSFWDGQLRFENVRFNFFDDQLYIGVSFLDNNGRKWAYADTINATLGNWPGRDYYIRNINIDKLTIQLLADTDKKTFPLKPSFSGSAPKDPAAVLRSVNINAGSLSVINSDGEIIYLGDIFLLAQRRKDVFEISTAINNAGTLDNLVFKGILSKDSFELNNTSGSLCNAKTKGHILINNENSGSSKIAGQFRLEDLEMARLAEIAGRSGKITTGKATLEYFYTAEKMDIDAFSGNGSLSIDNADMLPTPLLSKIFKRVGLADNELKATSDATMAFTTRGPLLTINQAYCTNQHGAILVEPGGTINLQEKALDIHITAIQFRQIGDFIRKIPVLRLFAKLRDNLTRFRIEGQWSEPASSLIKKEPLKDVKKGVVDFFEQIVQTSGQLTEPMLNINKENTEEAR